jgi:hypothetical protein
MERVVRLEDWFGKSLESVEASPDARAYLVSLFASMKSAEDDLSKKSIVLTYAEARDRGDFAGFQRLGDWVLWSMSFAPHSMAVPDLALDFGRLSYYACWRLTRKEWRVYEELADDLPRLSRNIRRNLGSTF